MDQRKLNDNANTLVDMAKVNPTAAMIVVNNESNLITICR